MILKDFFFRKMFIVTDLASLPVANFGLQMVIRMSSVIKTAVRVDASLRTKQTNEWAPDFVVCELQRHIPACASV